MGRCNSATSGLPSQVSYYLLWSSHRSDNVLLCCWFLVAVVKLFNAVAEAQHTMSGDVPLKEAKRAKEMSKDSTRCTALNELSRLCEIVIFAVLAVGFDKSDQPDAWLRLIYSLCLP